MQGISCVLEEGVNTGGEPLTLSTRASRELEVEESIEPAYTSTLSWHGTPGDVPLVEGHEGSDAKAAAPAEVSHQEVLESEATEGLVAPQSHLGSKVPPIHHGMPLPE
ncbi:hypothetical protein Nepgr_032556 [Nepenthes gracilis]|uniref:Uncharacterized protein n=1 Tax=Nepenthes gracilis TaxID=150966 RepID=A0AAD3TKN7_NEPGR|nr:hypothetical protein Nepgr_032556 [Nepenthes gracilis]